MGGPVKYTPFASVLPLTLPSPAPLPPLGLPQIKPVVPYEGPLWKRYIRKVIVLPKTLQAAMVFQVPIWKLRLHLAPGIDLRSRRPTLDYKLDLQMADGPAQSYKYKLPRGLQARADWAAEWGLPDVQGCVCTDRAPPFASWRPTASLACCFCSLQWRPEAAG